MQRKILGFTLALVLMVMAVASLTSAQATTFSVTLNGANEVPGPGDTDGTGSGTISIVGNEACFTGTITNVDFPITGLHIHDAPAGAAGPIVVDFGLSAGNPNNDGIFTEICGTADQAVIDDIVANPAEYYLNAHNAPFPGGAVRGQLEALVTFNVTLNGANEVPGPGDTDGTGSGTISIVGNEACFTGTITNVDFPITGLHIHDAPAGAAGPIVVDFGLSAGNPNNDGIFTEICGTADQAVIDDIVANPAEYYLNAHNAPFPGGAVRGQLEEVDQLTETPAATSTSDGTTTPAATATTDGTSVATATVAVTATTATGPGAFDLMGPPNGVVVRDVSDVTAITWGVSSGAISYNFLLFRLSNNTRIGEVLNVVVPSSACDASMCTLAVTSDVQMLLTDGQYAWTVIALGNDSSTTEASNSPFTFTINTGPVPLVINGGFEAVDEDGDATSEPWVGKNLIGDKVKCNNATKTFAYAGLCAFQFKGFPGEVSKLQQTLDFTKIYTGDTLTTSVYVDTNIAVPGKIVIVKVKYLETNAGAGNNGKDKYQLVLSAPTTNSEYQFFTGGFLVDGTVISSKISLNNPNPSGKIFFDEVQVSSSPDGPVIPTATPTTDGTSAATATATTEAGVTATATTDGTTTPAATATTDGTPAATSTTDPALTPTTTATIDPVAPLPLP